MNLKVPISLLLCTVLTFGTTGFNESTTKKTQQITTKQNTSQVLVIKGKITHIDFTNKKATSIMVKSIENKKSSYGEAVALITNKTKITLNNGTKTELRDGETVQVTFKDGPITMIYPPRIEAKQIKVLEVPKVKDNKKGGSSGKKVTKPTPKPPVKKTTDGGVDVVTSPTPNTKGGGINPHPGITTNDMPYTVVSDPTALPQTYVDNINNIRANRGYFYIKNGDNGYLFSVLSGEKPTGGYTVKIVSVQDVEGITTITVDERVPAKDEIVNMMVTYPTVTLSLKNINERIKVVNTNGEEYSQLSSK